MSQGQNTSLVTQVEHLSELLHPTDAIVILDTSGNIKSVNAAFYSLYGFEPADVAGLRHVSLFPIGSDSEKKIWKRVLNGEVVDEIVHQRTALDTTIFTHVCYSLIESDGNAEILMYADDQTEKTLLQLESKSIIDAIRHTQAVVEFDIDGYIIDANDHFLQKMKYKLEEIVGQHHRIFCNPTYTQSQEYSLFWNELALGAKKQGEFSRYNKNGEVVWLQATYTPILDVDGKVSKIIKFATDITSDKNFSMEFQNKVSAISRSQGMIEFDLAGNILSANKNFLEMMEYDESDLVGKHHRIFIDKEDADSAAYKIFWQKLGKGEYISDQFLRITKSGKRRWIQATYNPVLDTSCRTVKIVKFCIDITNSMNMNNENNAKLAAVSQASCVIEYNPDGYLLSVNDLCCQTLGYSAEQLIGKSIESIMFAEDINDAKFEENMRALSKGNSVVTECRRRSRSGAEIWLNVIMSPVMALDHKVEKIIVIGTDVTAQRSIRSEAESKINAINRSNAVIEFTPDGYITAANQNFLDVMGYQSVEVIGEHHRKFVGHEYAESMEYKLFWDSLNKGEYKSAEFKRIGRGGKEIWLRATYNPIFDDRHHVVKVIKFATDITEEKMKQSEYVAKMDALDLAQAVIEFDLEGNILSANRNFLAAMGYTLREIQGHHHSMFCTSDYIQSPDYRDFWLTLGEGKILSGRFHRIGKFNRDVWIQATYNPVRDLNGCVIKIVKYAYDVTKQVMLEQQILQKTNNITDTVKELIESINLVANNSEKAAKSADQSADAAQSGFDALAKSMSAIKSIQASSVKVTEIIRVIGEIANQTNLLAFNAAIEAARAGEHGVGFSVVATEVRKLAEKSAQAAKEINELIRESSSSVQEGAEVSKAAANSFEGIMTLLNDTVKSVNHIVEVTTSQKKDAKTVSDLINELMGAADDAGR